MRESKGRWAPTPRKGGGPKCGETEGGEPEGGAQNLALFFPLPWQISFFLLLLEVFSWNCRREFKTMAHPNPPKVRVRALNSRRRFHEKTSSDEKKERNFRRERKKQSDILGGPVVGRSSASRSNGRGSGGRAVLERGGPARGCTPAYRGAIRPKRKMKKMQNPLHQVKEYFEQKIQEKK